jgi:hypothetical protein
MPGGNQRIGAEMPLDPASRSDSNASWLAAAPPSIARSSIVFPAASRAAKCGAVPMP